MLNKDETALSLSHKIAITTEKCFRWMEGWIPGKSMGLYTPRVGMFISLVS